MGGLDGTPDEMEIATTGRDAEGIVLGKSVVLVIECRKGLCADDNRPPTWFALDHHGLAANQG